jgi:methionyl aminopeptidase
MPVCIVCSSPSKLKCPTCIKLGLNDSFYCSQGCFASDWNKHKVCHVSNEQHNPFPNFSFTGPLRPVYPLSPTRIVPEAIMRPDYANDPDGYPRSEMAIKGSSQIKVLNALQIEKMKKICAISREVLEEGMKLAKVGTTTDEIDRVIHDACIERSSYPSPLNYYKFPKSCCTSVNEVICHGIPDQYELKDGDILNIDVSVFHDGFHGDLNETMAIGNVDARGLELIKTTRECLDLAIAACKPGVLYRDMGNIIQKHASSHGFSVVKTYCGHGINEFFHCAPNVPHYSKNKAIGVMKPGHTFTIEPMISEGVWQDVLW